MYTRCSLRGLTCALLLAALVASAALRAASPARAANHRLIVLADMGNEPDEEQQMTIEQSRRARTEVTIPADAAGKQIHLILQVCDLNPIASLYDYRRVVVDVGAAQ